MRGAVTLALLVSGFWWLRSDPDVEKGNAKTAEGKYDEALVDFERAEKNLPDEDARRKVAFDRGLALHGAGKPDDAIKAFRYAGQSEDPTLRSRAAYNEGNVAMSQKDKKAAIEAFIRSLRADPHYAPAKRNLEYL